jgi:hypothetical protein
MCREWHDYPIVIPHLDCEACKYAWYEFYSCVCLYNPLIDLVTYTCFFSFYGCSSTPEGPPTRQTKNEQDAYRLANTYGLNPPRAVWPARLRNTYTGKYEPDHFSTAELRTMLLAGYADKTNILIRYNPLFNLPYPYYITGTLSPNAVAYYACFNGYANRPTYADFYQQFFIWWNGIDSWIINSQIGDEAGSGWKRTDTAIEGEYAPYDSATGTATVTLSPY